MRWARAVVHLARRTQCRGRDGRRTSTALSYAAPECESAQVPAPGFQIPMRTCSGCGAMTHTQDSCKPGYLPEHIVEARRKHAQTLVEGGLDAHTAILEASHSFVCMRCHQMTYNGAPRGEMQTIVADDFRKALQDRILGQSLRSSVVMKLADLTDFHASMIPDLTEIIGGSSPVILIGNKFDLLPKGASPLRIREWVKAQACAMHIPVRSVHVISSKTGQGVQSLMNDAEALAERTNRDIYVVGCCNVGKSTFINHLLHKGLIKGVNRGLRKTQIHLKNGMKEVNGQIPVTTSNIAGTTLDVIPFTIRRPASQSAIRLFDTPGVYADMPLLRRLTPGERDLVVVKRAIVPVTYRVVQGQSLLLSGLARIDHAAGPPFLFTSYTSPNIRLHITKTATADGFVRNRLDFLRIPSDPSRALGTLAFHEFRIVGAGWLRSSRDVWFDGLGWVGFTGSASIAIKVLAMGGVGIRSPLMPFDARSTTRRFTG